MEVTLANASQVLSKTLEELIRTAKNLERSRAALAAAQRKIAANEATFAEKAAAVAAMLNEQKAELGESEAFVAKSLLEQLERSVQGNGETGGPVGANNDGAPAGRGPAARFSREAAQKIVKGAITDEPQQFADIEAKVYETAPSIARSAIKSALVELRKAGEVVTVGERRSMAYRLG